jgi:hypothetical protein
MCFHFELQNICVLQVKVNLGLHLLINIKVQYNINNDTFEPHSLTYKHIRKKYCILAPN